jgi:hypothetical protein
LIDGDKKEFRKKFEASINHHYSEKYQVGIVELLVQEGIDALEDVLNAIQMKIPILIILVITL